MGFCVGNFRTALTRGVGAGTSVEKSWAAAMSNCVAQCQKGTDGSRCEGDEWRCPDDAALTLPCDYRFTRDAFQQKYEKNPNRQQLDVAYNFDGEYKTTCYAFDHQRSCRTPLAAAQDDGWFLPDWLDPKKVATVNMMASFGFVVSQRWHEKLGTSSCAEQCHCVIKVKKSPSSSFCSANH